MGYRVGFVGLGTMGRPMAEFILDAQLADGGSLTIHDLDRVRNAPMLERGARWADTPQQLGRKSDLVFFMVPEITDIRAVLNGDAGILAGLDHPVTLVVSSTCSPQEVRDLADSLAGAVPHVGVVDAPVSGGAEGAVSGTLSIMVGGDEDEVLPVIDILRAAGTPLHLGPVGAGQVAKACNQLIVAAEVVALAEASLLAERAGLDVAKLFGLLLGGYASSRVMEVKAHRFATHDHSPSGPAKFMIKDLRAVAEEAEQSGLALVTIEPLRKIFTDLTNAGFGDYDTAVVQRYLEILSEPATGGSPTV
jgi:2-hydroxy-3-oxopropionate reductase